MSELTLQRDILDSVEAAGGAGKKLSNRFLVGVADLYCKLPRLPGCFIEVKDESYPAKAEHVKMDLTVPQRRFLIGFSNAGDQAAVMCFLRKPNKLWFSIWPVDEFPADNWTRVDRY